jgi:hypothetical protein
VAASLAPPSSRSFFSRLRTSKPKKIIEKKNIIEKVQEQIDRVHTKVDGVKKISCLGDLGIFAEVGKKQIRDSLREKKTTGSKFFKKLASATKISRTKHTNESEEALISETLESEFAILPDRILPLKSCIKNTSPKSSTKKVSFDMPEEWNIHSIKPYLKNSPPNSILKLEKAKLLIPKVEEDGVAEEDYFIFGGREYRTPFELPTWNDFGIPYEIPYQCDECGAGTEHMHFENATCDGVFWAELSDEDLIEVEESRE